MGTMNTMLLWYLRVKSDVDTGRAVVGCVVRANTEADARSLAACDPWAPQGDIWTDSKKVTCAKLFMGGVPGVVFATQQYRKEAEET